MTLILNLPPSADDLRHSAAVFEWARRWTQAVGGLAH
jgi:hypothetical protein